MTVTIGRRELLAALGGAAVAWPLAPGGQEVAPVAARSVDRPARIAVISFIGPTVAQPYWREFRNGLRALGWIEGRNVTIAERFAEGEDERLPVIVDDIVAMKPEVIVIDGARVVRVFRERTAAIPIVTSVVSDPCRLRLHRELRSARRQCHGHGVPGRRPNHQAGGASEGTGARSRTCRIAERPRCPLGRT